MGEATDIVQKEMYTFDDGGGRSLTLRPEGTAPVCRAYLEHGMRKLPQPVKLWYLSSFFRAEAPQRGRYRQFWQVGAEAIGSDAPETDAELIVLLAELLDAVGVARTPAAPVEPRHAGDARRVPRGARRRTCARTRTSWRRRSAAASTSTRCGRSTPATPGTRAVMRDAPKLLDRLDPDDAEHFAQVRALLDDAGLRYELDPTLVRGLDYYTRTVFEFTSDELGAQSGVGGGGRYDGLIELLDGPPTPASRLGGRGRADAAGRAASFRPRRSSSTCTSRSREPATARRTAFELAREARRAGLAGAARAGRPLAQGAAQARRPDRRALRRDHRRQRLATLQGHGVRRAARHRSSAA